MSIGVVYKQVGQDFSKMVGKIIKDTNILSKYSANFKSEILYSAVATILRENKIDTYTDVSESRLKELLSEKALFNAIIDYHLSVLRAQISRQISWIETNDVPVKKEQIEARRAFLQQLFAINNINFAGNIEEAIRFKLKQTKEFSDVIMKTNLETLKDHNTLTIIEVITSLLKLFCMNISRQYYFDPIISNKCEMGNSFGTLWSGKSLNNVYMEQLKAKVEQLEHTCKIVSDSLNIQQDELVNSFQ